MAIDIEFRHDGVGIIYNCYGATSTKDFSDAKNSLLASPEWIKRIKKCRYAIIDTSVETISSNYQEMATIVARDTRSAAIAAPGALVAVSAPGDLCYGLARMCEVLVEQLGWETRVFRSRIEAELWIHQRAKDKFGIDLAPMGPAAQRGPGQVSKS